MIQDQYEVLETLGSGTYGTVCKIRRKQDNKSMVWKEINFGKMSEKEKTQLVAEVNILRELRNPFVVRYHDRIVDKPNTRLYIVMEHCAGGDLGRLIEKCIRTKSNLDESLIWKVFAQCILALKDCHRRQENGEFRPIIHRDIKPANILLDSTQNIKMGDFGLAKELSSKSKLAQTNVGTPYYMAPEIINEKDYDEKSDIWSLGCVLYELAALKPPFNASNAVSLAMKINNGTFSRLPAKYSDALQNTIKTMIQINPRVRPRVEDLEILPAIQPAMSQAKQIIKEYRFNQTCADQMRELKAKEDALTAREAQMKKYEASLKEKEQQLTQWAEQLKASATAAVAAEAAHRPQTRARSRLSMDRTTELMSIDEDHCESITVAESHEMEVRRGPVPLPESSTSAVNSSNSVMSMQPPFEIHTDDAFKKQMSQQRQVLRPVPTAAAYIGLSKPAIQPFSAYANNQISIHRRQTPIVTGAENAKENVYHFGTVGSMPPPPPPTAPLARQATYPSSVVSAPPSTVASVTSTTSTVVSSAAPAMIPPSSHRRSMEYDQTVENTIGSPWKKQRGGMAPAVAAAPVSDAGMGVRRGLQPSAGSHKAYGINQAPSSFSYEPVKGSIVGSNMLKNPHAGVNGGGMHHAPPATVQIDLHTLLRQNGSVN